MSNNHNRNISNYQHIGTLIRDLHTAKNIAHPETIVSPDANDLNKSLQIKTPHPHPAYRSAHHKLMVHHLSLGHPSSQQCMVIEEEELDSTEDVEDTHNMDDSLKLSSNHGTTKIPKLIHNDVNCTTIPTVMVNDGNEPLDLISTTQRRFSQLYLGLRRLSTSNTVG